MISGDNGFDGVTGVCRTPVGIMVPFPQTLTDGSGYRWDFQSKGGVVDGTGNAFDGAFLMLDFPNVTSAEEGLNGEMLTISGASAGTPGVNLSRNLYVPSTEGWARFVDSATNIGPFPVTYTFSVYSDYGADIATNVVGTSSGDTALTTEDRWVHTNGGTSPEVGFVFGNSTTTAGPSSATISGDDATVQHTVTIQPGETVSIMYFGVQNTDGTALEAVLADLTGPTTSQMLAGLDQSIVDSIANFELDAGPPPQTIYQGNEYSDFMTGTLEDEFFYALDGDDVVLAQGGHDQVTAGGGDDVVIGGDGNDRLNGGKGADVLQGDAGDDRLVGDGMSGVSDTATTTLPENSRELSLTIATQAQSTDASVVLDGIIGGAGVEETKQNIVFLIDTSSSMADLYSGGALVGDLNADGISNSYLDAAIHAFYELRTELIATGLAGAELSLIAFGSTATVGYSGVVGGLGLESFETLPQGGSTDFEIALQAAQAAFDGMEDGQNTLYFLSDGDSGVSGFTDEAADLRDPGSYGATIKTFAIGTSPSTGDLDLLDDGVVNGSVSSASNADDLAAALQVAPVTTADIASLEVSVNGGASVVISTADLRDTPLGVAFSTTVDGLSQTGADTIAVSLTATNAAASTLATSVTVANSVDPAGNDVIYGGDGADTGFGGGGDDVLLGGLGNDSLVGGAGNDDLSGDSGDDALIGGSGDDSLSGGSGSDLIDGGEGGMDMVVYAGSASAVTVDLVNQTATGGDADGDTLRGIEGVTGTSFDDVLTGDDNDNFFRPGLGADQVIGGAGFDTIDYSDAAFRVLVSINGASGTQDTGGSDQDFLDSIEGIIGSQFDDRLNGSIIDEVIIGGAGDDIIKGRGGNDWLEGGQGVDKLLGDDGEDVLYGGDGDDRVTGYGGNDIGYGDAGDDIVKGFDGDDTLYGGDGDDKLEGNKGDDSLYGDAGNDTLLGFNGSDTLIGGDGDDSLFGGNGMDVLNGGLGDDSLKGDVGGDTFVFEGQFGYDTVKDFEAGIDTLDVTALGLQSFADVVNASSDRSSGLRIQFSEDQTIFITGMTLAQLLTDDVLI